MIHPIHATINPSQSNDTMLDINDQLTWLRTRIADLENEERYDDCDALFAEFCEWFVTGSDADNTVLLAPQPTA